MKMDSFLLVKGALSQSNFPNFNIYKVTLRYSKGQTKFYYHLTSYKLTNMLDGKYIYRPNLKIKNPRKY